MRIKARDRLLPLLAVLVITLGGCASKNGASTEVNSTTGSSLASSDSAAAAPLSPVSSATKSSADRSTRTSQTTPSSAEAAVATATSPTVDATTPEPVTAAEPPPPVQLTLYSLGSNIRQGPTTDSAIVGSAYSGEILLVIDTGVGWFQLVDGRGFVSATLVSSEPPPAEPEPEAEPAPAAGDPEAAADPPVAAPPAPAPAGTCPAAPAACSYQQGGDFGVIAAINAERTAAGLPTLSVGDSSGSQSCALASAQAGSLNHCGYEALWGGSFVPDAASVVSAWMNSPGHRAMLLNPSKTTVSVGFATRSDQYTVVAATLS